MTKETFKIYRQILNLTQKQLAEEMGLSLNIISRYEQGSRKIPPWTEKHLTLLAAKAVIK